MANFIRTAKELDTHFMLIEMRSGMTEKEKIEEDIKRLELELKKKDALLDKHRGMQDEVLETGTNILRFRAAKMKEWSTKFDELAEVSPIKAMEKDTSGSSGGSSSGISSSNESDGTKVQAK